MGYEQMSNQFGDSKRAVNFLPKNMRSHLGQMPGDLGSKIAAVTTAVEAGALNPPSAPTAAPAPTKAAISVDIPYTPIVAVVALIAVAAIIYSKK